MSNAADAKRHFIEVCRGLPGATEDIKWQKDLIFSVGDRMFAGFDTEETTSVTMKVDPAVFPILTRTPGVTPARCAVGATALSRCVARARRAALALKSRRWLSVSTE